MKLYENGKLIAHPRNLADAKRIIAGLDDSMAVVDCDYQEYVVRDSRGNLAYYRPRIHVP